MEKSVVMLLFLFPFIPSSLGGYSAVEAEQLLYLTYSAYCSTSQLVDWDCEYCHRFTSRAGGRVTVTTLITAVENLFVYIGYRGEVGFVVARGADVTRIEDWIYDIDTMNTSYLIPASFGEGEVHALFYDAWTSVQPYVEAGIMRLFEETQISFLYFTGHSLGAAVCAWAALEIGTTLDIPVTVYTFGQPRIGNQAFANYWNSKIPYAYRVVNKNDCVPHLPLGSLRFWHSATEVWYKTESAFKVCDSSGEDPTCMNSLDDFWQWSITSHLDYFGLSSGLC